jgi:hypothetical protein
VFPAPRLRSPGHRPARYRPRVGCGTERAPRACNRCRVPAGDRYDGPLGSGRPATPLPLAWPGGPAAPIPPVWRSRAPHNPAPLSSDARGARSALPSPVKLDRRSWAASGHVTAEGGSAVPQTCAGFSAARLRVACVLAASGFTTWPAPGLHLPARLCARPGACMRGRQPWMWAARHERDAGGLAGPAQGGIPALVDRPRTVRQGRRVHRLPQAAGWPLAVPLCPHAGRAGVWAPDRGAGGPNRLRSGR